MAAVPTLMDNEAKADVKVFGVARSNAYDIMPLAECTPLGIYLNRKDSISIEVVAVDDTAADDYVLHDNLTNVDYALGTQVVVDNAETSIGRFVIRKAGASDALKAEASQGISIMQQGDFVVVASAADNLQSVEVRDLAGRLISKVQADGTHSLKTKINSGVQIVSIVLNDGETISYKLVFN